MDNTRVSTYDLIGSQKDAGERELSLTAPWGQQGNRTSPFATGEGKVNGFNPRRKLSQFIQERIEDGEQVGYIVDDFEDDLKSLESDSVLNTIIDTEDRNGTTSGVSENNYSSVSLFGSEHLDKEDQSSLYDFTEPSGVASQYLDRSTDPPLINQTRANRNLTSEKVSGGEQEKVSALTDKKYFFSQSTQLKNQTDINYPPKFLASEIRTTRGSSNAYHGRSQKMGDIIPSNDDDARAVGYKNLEHFNLQRKIDFYNDLPELNTRKNEPHESSFSKNQNKGPSIAGVDKIMRKEEIESSQLSYNQVPIKTSKTTGGVKFSRQLSQSGHLSVPSSESYGQRPISSQVNIPSFPMSRDRDNGHLEESSNKSRFQTNAGTHDRGLRRGRVNTRSLADDSTTPTSSSEAFHLFAKTQMIGLAKQEDLLTASVTQRRIRNQSDPNKMADEQAHLRRINYFGLLPIAEPPLDEPLIEILALKKLHFHASDMIVTSETYSEHQRLCNRTQISGPHISTFSTLFQRAGKVLSLLEKDINTCTNRYRITLFQYLEYILERYNEFGVQVVSYLPEDWESLSLEIYRYYLILVKEQYFTEAINCLVELNCFHETKMVSFLENEELISSQNHIEMEKDVHQDDDHSISSESAHDVYAELIHSKPNSKYSVRNQTQYDPRLNKLAKGISKSPNNAIRSPERVYHGYNDTDSPNRRGLSPLGNENTKKDGIPTTIELNNHSRCQYNPGEVEDLDDNVSKASTVNGRNHLPSRDKPGHMFTKDQLYALRDAEVLALQNKLGFSEHQRDAMLPGGIGSSTLNNISWIKKMSQCKTHQYCVTLSFTPGTDKLDLEKFLSDSAMKARTNELSSKELCYIFKETGMGPTKETTQSYIWNQKYPTIVNRVLAKANWEIGTDTGEDWLYWEILWNKIRIEIVALGIAKRNDNTLADRLENIIFLRKINIDHPNDIENLETLTTWVDKLLVIYRSSTQSKTNYSYLWFFVLRKLSAVNCPYIMIWTQFLKSQMNKAMTLMNLSTHDRQILFGTTDGFEREEDYLQKVDFEWAFDCLRTAHVNNQLDYSIAIVCIRTDQASRRRSFAPPPPPPAQSNKQRKVNSATPKNDFSLDMFGGQDIKTLNPVEKNLRKESYLLTNSIPILSMLKEKTKEQIEKAAKFKEFLNKHQLTICKCGLMKEITQSNDKCEIIVDSDFKIGPFVTFLKNKSQRLGRKFTGEEVLQHLQYVKRNSKWDDVKLQAYHKSVMEKWTPINLSPAAIAKVLSVISNLSVNGSQTEYEGGEEDVSYSETDSSHF
jgi:hypothetical protein